MNTNQDNAAAWSYYSKDFNLVVEVLTPGYEPVYKITHEPSGKAWHVVGGASTKTVVELLRDKYLGLPIYEHTLQAYADEVTE